MKSIKKFAFWVMIALIIVVSFVAFYILSMDLHSSDIELKEELITLGLEAHINRYQEDKAVLRYVHLPNRDSTVPILLTLHGAPGSCSDYLMYWSDEALRSQFEIVSVDRPGYGGSHFNTLDISIEQQATEILKMILNLREERDVIILSHSYGGPVGAKLAALLGSICLGHVMVAPVLNPVSEEIFWYSSIPAIRPFSWFSSNDWKNATAEKLGHVRQLEILQPYLKDIPSRTIHIHGTEDWLAPFDNVAFAQTNFRNDLYKPIVIEEGSHFILWEDEIVKIIKEQIVLLDKADITLMSQ